MIHLEKTSLRSRLTCILLTLIILSSSVFYGCNSAEIPDEPITEEEIPQYTVLTKGITPHPVPERLADHAFYDAVKGFSSDLMLMSLHGTENVAISPLSIMNSLLLMSNGSAPLTSDEILGLFNKSVTQTQFNEYMATYLTELKRKSDFGISASFWINQKGSTFKPKESFLQLNANYYLADGFSYDGSAISSSQIINSWIKNNSEFYGISLDSTPIPSTSSIITLSGIYGQMKWAQPFSEAKKDVFRSTDGEKSVNYMYSSETERIYLGNSAGFIKTLTNGCKVAAIIPNTDVKLSAMIEFIDFIGISSILDYTYTGAPFTVSIPEFTYSKIIDCTSVLSKCGLNRALSAEQSGFSSLSEDNVPLYLSEIYSAVSISFGPEGVIAGGASADSGSTDSPVTSEPTAEADLVFNHPFIYIVYDPNNVPLFIGNVVNP